MASISHKGRFTSSCFTTEKRAAGRNAEKSFLFFAIAFCCLWFFPSVASGAPFCVEYQGLPPECWYYDVRSCKQEAAKRKGFCSVNIEEVKFSEDAGGAPFCIIDSGMVPVCAYQNGEDCNEIAESRFAVCFVNANSGGNRDDPYRYDRPLYRDR